MDKQRLIELYKKGKTDVEIASIMNVSRQLIQFHRTKMGLKSNFSYKPFKKNRLWESRKVNFRE